MSHHFFPPFFCAFVCTMLVNRKLLYTICSSTVLSLLPADNHRDFVHYIGINQWVQFAVVLFSNNH